MMKRKIKRLIVGNEVQGTHGGGGKIGEREGN